MRHETQDTKMAKFDLYTLKFEGPRRKLPANDIPESIIFILNGNVIQNSVVIVDQLTTVLKISTSGHKPFTVR